MTAQHSSKVTLIRAHRMIAVRVASTLDIKAARNGCRLPTRVFHEASSPTSQIIHGRSRTLVALFVLRQCLGCHKAGKQAETGKTAPFCDDDRMGQGEEEAEDEDEEKKRRNLEDMTVQCETPGCDNGRFQLGVCCSCFAR